MCSMHNSARQEVYSDLLRKVTEELSKNAIRLVLQPTDG
jgi:hypothetical protein